jgi:hypothetical protein
MNIVELKQSEISHVAGGLTVGELFNDIVRMGTAGAISAFFLGGPIEGVGIKAKVRGAFTVQRLIIWGIVTTVMTFGNMIFQ